MRGFFLGWLLLVPFSAPLWCQEATSAAPSFEIGSVRVENFISGDYSCWAPLGGKIAFHFDVLRPDFERYSYTVVPCDADWNPADVPFDLYATGFVPSLVDDMQSSTGTLVAYVHYTITFPNPNFSLHRSGNYLLEVYDEDEELVLTQGFGLYESLAQVSVAQDRGLRAQRNDAQQLTVSVSLSDQTFDRSSCKIRVIKNHDFGANSPLISPTFTYPDRWVFARGKDLTFEAGNSFRSFDAKSVYYGSTNIADISLGASAYRLELFTDVLRADRYADRRSIWGAYVVHRDEAAHSEVDADYVWVAFKLRAVLREGQTPYIVSRFGKKIPMKYHNTGYYYAQDFFKQGFYSYRYALQNGASLEGNYYINDNHYTVLVYLSDGLGDRMVGIHYPKVLGNGARLWN